MRNRLILILFLITVFTILGAFLLSRQLVKPLVKMKMHLTAMASGNYQDGLIALERNDEIGDMFSALDQLINSIRQTMHFADEIGTMNLDAQYQMLGANDRLGRSLLSMRENLKVLKAKEEKLQLATEKSLLQGQEKERNRLSREMHDGLGPLLTSLKMMVQRLNLEPREKENIKKILDDTIAEVRRMTYNLMPQALVDFGVAQALENLVALTTRVSGVRFKYTHAMPPDHRLEDEINIGLYRIAQEVINNSLKHSGASEMRMSLTQFDDRISFYFSDNGSGFKPETQHAGAGLVNIRERCRILNGEFKLESNDQGTTIEIEIPTEL